MKKVLLLLSLLIIMASFKNDKPAYQFYTQEGKAIKYQKMLKTLQEADVVFFGELHNNPICHWLQLELTKDLYLLKNGEVTLGAEMFEKDDQLLLDEYLEGRISQSSFEKEARLWSNYKTDYKPLVEFAKDSGLQFIATNIPRRYASMVYGGGFESLEDLSPEAKGYVAPLPVEYNPELPGYNAMLQMGGGHGGDNLPKAQAIKDATMAYSIAGWAGEGKLFIHYNGTYHSNDFEGILWYLNKYLPGLSIMTISSVEQESIEELEEENLNKANFILAIPANMTKTY
jgi:uncharacterized iron-regulated protein